MIAESERQKEEDLRNAFDMCDTDGSGAISKAELRSLVEALGEKLTSKEIDDLLKAADSDGDDRVTFEGSLTLSQTTNFILFETKEFADDNYKFDENGRIVLQTGRKHCGQRRNCSSRAISPFAHSVFEILVLQTRKNQGLSGLLVCCIRV